MGLSTALGSAVSGLRANQAQMDIVADNVANADTPGFTRKSVDLIAAVAGERSAGVRVGQIQREFDAALQRQIRTETAGAAYAAVKKDFLFSATQIFGTPGSDAAIDSIYNKFLTSLQTLSGSPESFAAQRAVLNDATVLTQSLNQMTSDIQALRTDAERAIAENVRVANMALAGIEAIDRQIGVVGDAAPAALLDQRDRYINDLSKVMDIRLVKQDGNRVNIYTSTGVALYNGRAGKLTFDERSQLTTNSLYSNDADLRGVGTVYLSTPDGGAVDLLAGNYLRSGEMAAYVELRDQTLVQMQNRLDSLAGSLAKAMGNSPLTGTAITNGFSLPTSGVLDGNNLRLSFTDSTGASRNLTVIRVEDSTVLPLSNDATPEANDEVLGISFSDMNAVAAAIQTRMGAGFTVSMSGSTLSAVTNGSQPSAAMVGASGEITNTALQGQGLGVPLFTDGANGQYFTDTQSAVPQRRGFAGRIAVNANLAANPEYLTQYTSTTPFGDSSRPDELYDRLANSVQLFSSDTGLGSVDEPFRATPQDFMRSVIDVSSFDYETASRLSEGQTIVLQNLQEKFQETSGVNVDRELASLLTIQNSYAANARVMSVIKDMFDILMRM